MATHLQSASHDRRVGGSTPETIFVWIALIVAIAFAATVAAATDTGILNSAPPPMTGDSVGNGSGAGYFIMAVIGAFALGVALLYGLVRYHTRNRANDPITEAATRAEYRDPEGYDQHRASLNAQLKPS